MHCLSDGDEELLPKYLIWSRVVPVEILLMIFSHNWKMYLCKLLWIFSWKCCTSLIVENMSILLWHYINLWHFIIDTYNTFITVKKYCLINWGLGYGCLSCHKPYQCLVLNSLMLVFMLDFALPVPSLIKRGGWRQEGHPAIYVLMDSRLLLYLNSIFWSAWW